MTGLRNYLGDFLLAHGAYVDVKSVFFASGYLRVGIIGEPFEGVGDHIEFFRILCLTTFALLAYAALCRAGGVDS